MKIIELIDKCIIDKTRCFVNGMNGGNILKREEDYVEFEILDIQVEKKSQKEKTTREKMVIPMNKVDIISFGQEVKEVNMLDKAMKALEE